MPERGEKKKNFLASWRVRLAAALVLTTILVGCSPATPAYAAAAIEAPGSMATRTLPGKIGFYGSSTAVMEGTLLQKPEVVARIKARFPEIVWIKSFGLGGAYLHDLGKDVTVRNIIPVPEIPAGTEWFLIGKRNDSYSLHESGQQIAGETRQEITTFQVIFGKNSIAADVIPYPVPGTETADAELVQALFADPTILGGVPLIDTRQCYLGTSHLDPADMLHTKDMEGYLNNILTLYQNGTCAVVYP